ncbi:hypothetical protein USDA257_c17570 [Sinorhizobium fredii USDA 257]|uniref:Uncharacterized protein n=1 Tax=Sinorhizobium fredii (strain USDA 257) TaxID=1185652 RepID=I3X389_SINF2|nr:hypothetical protein USDA257_c17570 [Sinorhizobium fredii USDA 257]
MTLKINSIPLVEGCKTEAFNLNFETAFKNANKLLALVSIKAFTSGARSQGPLLAIHHPRP